MTNRFESDRTDRHIDLAERLSRRQPTAVQEFAEKIPDRLRREHTRFQDRTNPKCVRSRDSLTPHVGFSAGTGYLKYRETAEKENAIATSFFAFVERLHLADVYHASACLPVEGDNVSEPALKLLMKMIESVGPILCRKVGNSQFVNDAVNNLPSHVITPGKNGKIPLAGYSGRCRLATWLTTLGYNQLVSASRKTGHSTGSDPEGEDREPEGAELPPTAKGPVLFMRLFYPYIKELVSGLRDSDRLEKLAVQQGLSDRQKERYREGLADKQKLVFRLLYYKGMPPSKVAEILGVSRQLISLYIREYRTRLAILAPFAVAELAESCGVSIKTTINSLHHLFQFLANRELDSEWESLSDECDPLQEFLNDLRKHSDP